MEALVSGADWLLRKVLTKLSDELVAKYVASLNLGHNLQDMQTKLYRTQWLLSATEGMKDVSGADNRDLQKLLHQLSKKADEADDALDELHYFIIQDQLLGTHEADIQEPAPGICPLLQAHSRHAHHVLRHTVGNCLRCFPCLPTQDDDDDRDVMDPLDKLRFDRVAMSNKIKSLIQDIHSMCDSVSGLLSTIPNNIITTAAPPTRPPTGATIKDTLFGRKYIFDKTLADITAGYCCCKTLSVLPISGPGGIGKTTFTQHLYNKTQDYFPVRVWVCVPSTGFDVLNLTQQILDGIPKTEKEPQNNFNAYLTTNLDKLQTSIADMLKSQRFLIVLDDIWKCSLAEWQTFLAPFKSGQVKGSMVLVTTRFPQIANMVKTMKNPIHLQGLDSSEFLTFFEACIFGGDDKPLHYHLDGGLACIASDIAKKLKGSPLAAITVGHLLQKDLSQEHWKGVLQNNKWRYQKNTDDIMPSLKISYDYLSFDLKKRFSCLALFPEDHRFYGLEIDHFWSAIGIIDSSEQKRNYLEELVQNGFLMKVVDYSGHYYVMHDLMHELSLTVSAQECLNISSLDFKADNIQETIRHLSIIIEDRYDENFGEEMRKLKGRIDMVNLRTLMIFRGYEDKITDILKDTFKEINGLRVLFIVVESQGSLPCSLPKFIHLQYLKISSAHYYREMDSPLFEPFADIESTLPIPSSLCRFYHLKFLDLSNWNGSSSLPKDISNLVNLRHFLVANKELHSNVPGVGKMKCLKELKEFHVKKERDGFELRELGELRDLGGELSVCNLECAGTKEEASQAKLKSKKNLKELRLVWGREQPAVLGDDVVDLLEPHHDLRALHIINHRGATSPSWLYPDNQMKNLKALHIEGVSWGCTLPPFGQLLFLEELTLMRISGVRQLGPDYGGVAGKSFMCLKNVVFDELPEFVTWVVEPNCHCFLSLESIKCRKCPNLCYIMPLSECSSPNLCSLDISDCPKLSLPPMPHTCTLRRFEVNNYDPETLTYSGNLSIHKRYKSLSYDGKRLSVNGYNGALAFHNMDQVDDMRIESVSHLSLTGLENLKSLRELSLTMCGSISSQGSAAVSHSVERIHLHGSHLTRNMLSALFSFFAALSVLNIHCLRDGPEERVLEFPSSSSLQTLVLSGCKRLVLVPAEDGGGVKDMASLQSLTLRDCGNLFSRWPVGGDHTVFPFPASLRELDVEQESSMQSMALLSNLTCLTHLRLVNCYSLTMDGFNPLITANLKELVVSNLKQRDGSGPDSVAADLLSEVLRMTRPDGYFQLEKLEVDSIFAVLSSPVCSLVSSTLHTLVIRGDHWTQSFNEEQEKALQLLTCLQKLQFYACKGLQSLPQGLHRLSSLKELEIDHCYNLRWLPKEGFPTSLIITPSWSREQIEKLKRSNLELQVTGRS